MVDSEKSSSSTLTGVSQNSSSDYHYHYRSQGSLSSTREWDIPFDELQLEQVIGTGRYSTVYQGYWHGEVAIKQLDYNHLGNGDERGAFDTFKQEVDIFRMTRHDNLVLFMGACMAPPHLAIVTSLCKGVTLHSMIHKQMYRFDLVELCNITEQVRAGLWVTFVF